MKTVLKILIPAAAFFLLARCEKNEFDETGYKILKFQDPKFEAALLAHAGLDQNGDGKISIWELARATSIDCTDAGIQHAPELKHCSDASQILFTGNSVSDEIDISRLKNLITANFAGNGIKGKFNMAQNYALSTLDLSNNNVEELVNLEGASQLRTANFSNNKLKGTLDFSKLRSLVELDLTGNSGLQKLLLHERYITTPLTLNIAASVVVEYRDEYGEKVEPDTGE